MVNINEMEVIGKGATSEVLKYDNINIHGYVFQLTEQA